MESYRLTVKNYRCFEDTAPLVLDLQPGITALVGPNNSGKSTALKLFHELRTVLQTLGNYSNLDQYARGQAQGGSKVTEVADYMELFHDGNPRPLTLSLDFPPGSNRGIRSVTISCNRDNPSAWLGEVTLDGGHRATHAISIDNRLGFAHARGSVLIDVPMLQNYHDLVSRSLYVGPFRSAIGESTGVYYGLAIGKAFVNQWTQWQTGADRRQRAAVGQVCEDVARIMGFRSLEITATNEGTLSLMVDRKPYFLRELGSGLSEFIIVFGNVMMRQPSLLLLDEPESHLHPSLQADFLLSLAERTSYGVMCATHSIGLARTTATPLYSFRREDTPSGHRTQVRPFERTTDFAEFLGEMSFSAFQELGYSTILLAEGITEVLALQGFLKLYGRDHQVVVLPMGGDQFFAEGRAQELSELRRLSNNVAILIDSERSEADAPIPELRASFLETCRSLGFRTHATERRAFENYLTTDALRLAFPKKSLSALDPHESLKTRDAGSTWSKSENWRVARRMTRADLEGTDLGTFLSQLP